MGNWAQLYADLTAQLQAGQALGFWDNAFVGFYQSFVAAGRWRLYLNGLLTTLEATILALLLGVVLGVVVAVIRTAHDQQRAGHKNVILGVFNAICKIYTTIIRGTPMMVQSLIFYYAIFNLFKRTGMSVTEINRVWSLFISGLVTVSLNSTAYLAEVLRGGILAVDAGQMEAARSLGMTHWQAMRRVVFPQAIKNSLPAIGNEFIINIKDSSVLCVLGVSDLMFMTRSVAGIYYKGTECYLIAATVYLFLTYLSSLLLKAITGRMTAPDNTKRRQGNQTVDLGLPSSN